MPGASTGQQKGFSSPQQCLTIQHTTSASKVEMNWATKYCLIRHIHLTSHQPTTTSSSISTTICSENASMISRMHEMLSKSSSNPEAQIFMLQE